MIKGLFIFCVISISACFGVLADDAVIDPARAAMRGNAIMPSASVMPGQINTTPSRTTTTTSRQQPANVPSASIGRATGTTGATMRDAPNAPQTGRAATTGTREISTRATSEPARATSLTTSRAATAISQTPTKTGARTITRGDLRNVSVPNVSARGAVVPNANTSRAANLNTQSLTFGEKDYSLCRDTYFQCMDEFCANKDAQLRRCACSKRVHDFDKIQRNLETVETKMLDFNERLLTVSMDKEDALAINKATEGELAFQVDDNSPSQKILDTIRKKLNQTSADSKDMQSLAMISLSIDTTNVFDTIDATLGASTTTKEGDALYRSALPVCKDIAAEVCSPDDISIAEAAYQMAIEQDCNTVTKAFESLQAAALQKAREGNALLDMSRLQDHQTRNADDTLTCKTKMLEMLHNEVVCGSDLGKCLDWSGKYIDPSTGQAILTSDLSNLSSMLKAPTNDVAKWVQMKENQGFVKFLNAKKKYIEPAMKGCEDIADMVWNGFLEDALAQIKIAQNSKLEDMRQGCTSVTATCLTGQAQALVDFDARALSIFGVSADTTVNKLCAHIKTACTSLIDQSGDTSWSEGMTEVARDKSYDQIINTCLEVGKNCIVQNCVSAAGNFGLCIEDTSINRRIILKRVICWEEVLKCVNNSDTSTLNKIYSQYTSRTFNPNADDNVDACGHPSQQTSACRIAKSIWGSCNPMPEVKGSKILSDKVANSSGKEYDTILSWLNTATNNNSCYSQACPPGTSLTAAGCKEGTGCPPVYQYSPFAGLQACCRTGTDGFGNCCANGVQFVPITLDNSAEEFFRSHTRSDVNSSSSQTSITPAFPVCSQSSLQFIAKHRPYGSNAVYLFCVANGGTGKMSGQYTTGGNGKCDGKFLEIIAGSKAYAAPLYTTITGPASALNITMSFESASGNTCTWDNATNGWTGGTDCASAPQNLEGVKKLINIQ